MNSPIHLFEARAREHPGALALQLGDDRMTYGELNRCVAHMVTRMRGGGVTRGVPLGLFVDVSFEMIVGYFAILKYGCQVVPIDVDSPPSRRDFIVKDSGTAFVLTRPDLPRKLAQDGIKMIDIEVSEALAAESVQGGCTESEPLMGPAVIVYTSGSTGVPKGVVITHANLMHYVAALEKLFAMQRHDIYLLRGSVTLITFARQLLMPLSLGASVVVASDAERKDPLAIFALVKRTQVTIFDHVPSFWKGLIASLSLLGESERRSLFDLSVRLVAAGGENFPSEIVPFWFSNFGKDVAFYHLYGQTEGTGVVSAFRILPEQIGSSSSIPIGKPVIGMEMRVLDAQLQPVAAKEIGEICIYGHGVAMGYWNRPALTGRFFLSGGTDPSLRMYRTGDYGRFREDGELEFLGRIDHQLKIRGHRVELAEVENAIHAHPAIEEAVVVNCPSAAGDSQLIGYFKADRRVENSELIMFLMELLPPHMLPSRSAQLAQFPLLVSGKVDRQALQTPEFTMQLRANTAVRRPAGDLQQRIAKVWEAVLGVKEVGVDDSFFGLGGDSLKAVTLILAIEKELGVSISVEKFQQFSTIESLANDLTTTWEDPTTRVSGSLSEEEYKKQLMIILGSELQQVQPGSLMLQSNEKGRLPPLFWCFNALQKEMSALARELPQDQPLFGLLSSVRLQNNQETLERVAAHYVEELLRLFPAGPFRLGGNCRGAKVACEMVRMLEMRGIQVEKLCLLEFFHPDLYRYRGDLCLLFGRYSHLKRYELLKFDQEGWDKPFATRPAAEWIDCAHGVFFESDNVGDLSSNVKRWLYNEGHEIEP